MDTQQIDVDKLEASPELNALVAQHVVGLERRKITVGRPTEIAVDYWCRPDGVPIIEPYEWTPSLDIAVAWEVVEHLWDNTPRFYLLRLTNDVSRYYCEFGRGVTTNQRYGAFGETAPLAICRAALKAVLQQP